MSYPYGGNTGYPGGPPGGYPQQGGYPQPGGAPGYPQPGGPPGGYPQQGYGQPPQGGGMPTPESASAAAYGQQPGGLPYGSAPPGGAPGQIGFSMGGGPPQPGYPQAPGVSMPGAPGATQPTYQQNMPYGGSPAYNTPVPPAGGGYPGQPPAAGYPGQPPQGGYSAAGGYPGAPPATQLGGAPGYPGQAPAPGGYGGYGQSQPSAPGGVGYQSGSTGSHGQYSGSSQGGAHSPYKQREDGTLKPYANFNAESDAKILRKAMKGFGTDEKAIIDILAYRTNSQRQEIKKLFKTMYGKDLIHELKSELGGKFEDVILGLMMSPDEYDAYELRRAIQGFGTDEDALIEILSSRSNAQIREIQTTYKRLYHNTLERDIMGDTSGHFKRLMVSMATGNRMESQGVDNTKANQDAQALFQAGAKRLGTDESTFNAILASQSHEQLRAVFDAYQRISGKSMEQAIRSEMSGNLEIGMLAIVGVVKNKPGYFAQKLYHSMKGAGTDDKTLIRIIVTRAEVDMVQIKQAFQQQFHKSLEEFIRGDTSGDYRRVLLALVTGQYNY